MRIDAVLLIDLSLYVAIALVAVLASSMGTRMGTRRGATELCPRCGALKGAREQCSECGDTAGKNLPGVISANLERVSRRDGVPVHLLARQLAQCPSCGRLMFKRAPCPRCGRVWNGSGMVDPLAHWMHQDDTLWRPIGWIIPIEAGVLTGAFLRPGLPGFCLVCIGSVATIAFSMIAWKSTKDRDVNLAVIDRLKPAGMRLTFKAPWYRRGSFWLRVLFVLPFIVNAFLLTIEFWKWQGVCPAFTSQFFPPVIPSR